MAGATGTRLGRARTWLLDFQGVSPGPQGWVQVRSSNTEPIMRIFAEAKDKATAEELIGRITSIAQKID